MKSPFKATHNLHFYSYFTLQSLKGVDYFQRSWLLCFGFDPAPLAGDYWVYNECINKTDTAYGGEKKSEESIKTAAVCLSFPLSPTDLLSRSALITPE